MKSCPTCGYANQGFIVKGQMAGPAQSYYDRDGNYSELNMDSTYWKNLSTVVRCANCGKIRKDVYLYDRTTIKEIE